jgi:chemotaxis protein MotB
MYQEILHLKAAKGLDWLYVENTGTKGLKLLIPSRVGSQPMFFSGEDRINPPFEPYLRAVADIIDRLHLERILEQNRPIVTALREAGKAVKIELTVEGHTDYLPLRAGRFKDNWDLSLARSYSVMRYLQSLLPLPLSYFSLAGYGSFKPLRDRERLDENRRVEIYIDVRLVEAGRHV